MKRPTYQLLDATFSTADDQFEVGQTYRAKNPIELDRAGFLTWDYPLFMFSYTGRILARYALNEVAGSVVHRGEAVVSEVLTIRQELQLDEIIDHSVSWALTFGREPRETSPTHPVPGVYLENVAACDGERTSISVSGNRTSAVSRGVFSSAATAGYNSIAATNGENSACASAGHVSIAIACGPLATAAASGKSSRAAASGARSKAVAAGEGIYAECAGAQSVAAAIGRSASAKASAGSLLVLVHYDKAGNPLKAVSAIASADGPVKPDIWYALDEEGRFVEAWEIGVIVVRRKPAWSMKRGGPAWRLAT